MEETVIGITQKIDNIWLTRTSGTGKSYRGEGVKGGKQWYVFISHTLTERWRKDEWLDWQGTTTQFSDYPIPLQKN